jgi:hypothetical protein
MQKSGATPLKSGLLVEQFSFLIKDFKIDHQGEKNNLIITIRYQYRTHISNTEYPDFTMIAKEIETLLTNYPNESDYWEIVNKKITLMVLEKYPAITRITSKMEVSPSPKNSYVRSSIVTRDRTSVRPNRGPRPPFILGVSLETHFPTWSAGRRQTDRCA